MYLSIIGNILNGMEPSDSEPERNYLSSYLSGNRLNDPMNNLTYWNPTAPKSNRDNPTTSASVNRLEPESEPHPMMNFGSPGPTGRPVEKSMKSPSPVEAFKFDTDVEVIGLSTMNKEIPEVIEVTDSEDEDKFDGPGSSLNTAKMTGSGPALAQLRNNRGVAPETSMALVPATPNNDFIRALCLENKFVKLRHCYDKLKRTSEAEIKNLRTDNDELKLQVGRKRAEMVGLRNKISAKDKHISALNEEVEHLRAANGRTINLEVENSRLLKRVELLESALKEECIRQLRAYNTHKELLDQTNKTYQLLLKNPSDLGAPKMDDVWKLLKFL